MVEPNGETEQEYLEAFRDEPKKEEEPKFAQPQVDDQFWFDTSKELVQKSLSSVDAAADKLQSLIGWLWGIYTAGAAIGLSLAKLTYSVGILILIASPSVALIVAYLMISTVYSPKKVEIKYKVPYDIKKKYSDIVQSKYYRYLWSFGMTAIAAVLVAVALITASVVKQPQPTEPAFQANLLNKELTVSGSIAASTNYVIKLGLPPDATELPGITSGDGKFSFSTTLKSAPDSIVVAISWADSNEVIHSIQQTIKQINSVNP